MLWLRECLSGLSNEGGKPQLHPPEVRGRCGKTQETQAACSPSTALKTHSHTFQWQLHVHSSSRKTEAPQWGAAGPHTAETHFPPTLKTPEPPRTTTTRGAGQYPHLNIQAHTGGAGATSNEKAGGKARQDPGPARGLQMTPVSWVFFCPSLALGVSVEASHSVI